MTEQAHLEDVRDHVGTSPDDATVFAALNRFPEDDPHRVVRAALSILKRRLIDMDSEYATFSVDGDASWSQASDQRAALRARIGRLERLCGAAEDPGVLLPTLQEAPIVGPASGRAVPGCRGVYR